MKLTIEVTQQDIDKGIKEDASRCPIAKATRRALQGIKDVEISSEGSFTWSNKPYQFRLTKTMEKFMNKFDELGKKGVKPFKNVVNATEY
jgi:hypothetical protein